ncbi:MAG: metallophosphoesterase [Cardiobacteriaceae bacterium]|nr:metallophosphoesterase [Cardiobacteriaceae bacterium]
MPRWLFLILVIVLLQVMLWTFARTLRFIVFKEKNCIGLTWMLFIMGNGLLIISMTRVFPYLFIVLAWCLALLWLWFMASVTGYILFRFAKIACPDYAALFLRAFIPLLFISLVSWGMFNAYATVVRYYTVQLDKKMLPLRIGVASDIHLGAGFFFGACELDKLVALMQAEKVDLILLPGDIINDNVVAYHKENMQPHLQALHAPLGVYGTLGNHEFYGDAQENAQALRDAGVHLLRDAVTVVDNRVVIVGRDDDLHEQRPSLAALLRDVRHDLPIIVMDHRPTEIMQNVQTAMDIQVSGHAHKGQIFPANFITQALYTLHYGHKNIGEKEIFVTSGYGFWGVPLRIGSRSEIFIIDIQGKT